MVVGEPPKLPVAMPLHICQYCSKLVPMLWASERVNVLLHLDRYNTRYSTGVRNRRCQNYEKGAGKNYGVLKPRELIALGGFWFSVA